MLIRNATLPDGRSGIDLLVREGRIAALGAGLHVALEDVLRGVVEATVLQPEFLPARIIEHQVQLKHDFGAAHDGGEVVHAGLVAELEEFSRGGIIAEHEVLARAQAQRHGARHGQAGGSAGGPDHL